MIAGISEQLLDDKINGGFINIGELQTPDDRDLQLVITPRDVLQDVEKNLFAVDS